MRAITQLLCMAFKHQHRTANTQIKCTCEAASHSSIPLRYTLSMQSPLQSIGYQCLCSPCMPAQGFRFVMVLIALHKPLKNTRQTLAYDVAAYYHYMAYICSTLAGTRSHIRRSSSCVFTGEPLQCRYSRHSLTSLVMFIFFITVHIKYKE
jgi:hypothetical protein